MYLLKQHTQLSGISIFKFLQHSFILIDYYHHPCKEIRFLDTIRSMSTRIQTIIIIEKGSPAIMRRTRRGEMVKNRGVCGRGLPKKMRCWGTLYFQLCKV